MKTAATADGPLIEAVERERFPWFLFVCVLLSFLAHAASFLLFQVVYPQHVTVPPPPPQVQLLAPETPQYEAIMSWVDAEDPALTASAHSVRPANLLEVPYRPSFAIQRTAPRGVPETQVPIQFPAARRPLEIIRSAEPRPVQPTTSAGPLKTQLTVSPTLVQREWLQAPDLAVAARASAAVEPSQYLIGVNDRGEVRFVFLQRSSGHPELDAAGQRSLTRASFTQSENPMVWGFATIAWGDEILVPPRADVPKPSQP